MTLQHVLAADAGVPQPGAFRSGVSQTGIKPSGNLAPAGIERVERSDRSGRGLAAGASAWNKVFDAQQMAALDRFHSVGKPAAASPARHGLLSQPVPEGRRGQSGAVPGAAMKTMPGAMPGAGVPQPGAAAIVAGPARPGAAVSLHLQQALQTAASAAMPTPACAGIRHEAPGGVECMPQSDCSGHLAAILDTLAGRQWPRKNIHLAATAEGTYIWLRDSATMAGPESEVRLAARLRAVFRQSGDRLAGVSLNGIRII